MVFLLALDFMSAVCPYPTPYASLLLHQASWRLLTLLTPPFSVGEWEETAELVIPGKGLHLSPAHPVRS